MKKYTILMVRTLCLLNAGIISVLQASNNCPIQYEQDGDVIMKKAYEYEEDGGAIMEIAYDEGQKKLGFFSQPTLQQSLVINSNTQRNKNSFLAKSLVASSDNMLFSGNTSFRSNNNIPVLANSSVGLSSNNYYIFTVGNNTVLSVDPSYGSLLF